MSRSCRFCEQALSLSFVDLGMSPLSNAFIRPERSSAMEKFYPLHVFVCERCYLAQLEEFESPDQIFSDYVYFSSYSTSWLDHARRYCDHIIEKVGITKKSFVVEVASNDGYLLRNFVEKGIPCLGIEPAANVAEIAVKQGVPTRSVFFTEASARELVQRERKVDLLIGNNVFAHVPNINDFVAGMKVVLAPEGVITLEFPHLLQLIENNQFDTIYHEHFSYLSLLAVEKIFAAHGLSVFCVDELPTHGGSLRVYGQHADSGRRVSEPSVDGVRARERAGGLHEVATYRGFKEKVEKVKRDLLEFLITAKRGGKRVVAYGAAAKGNTLLNYCGIRQDFMDFVVDKNPHKQGLLTPGAHIPVHGPERLMEAKPDYVLILPWNIQDEVMSQLAGVREWGGKFVVPIPELKVLP